LAADEALSAIPPLVGGVGLPYPQPEMGSAIANTKHASLKSVETNVISFLPRAQPRCSKTRTRDPAFDLLNDIFLRVHAGDAN
jgi:hypothetical protein